MRFCVAIVEDEEKAAQDLKSCLERLGAQMGQEFQITHYSDAKVFLWQYEPVFDLIFMDIRMPGIDGMTAAEKLREKDTVTTLVFVTSMVQYAIKGYAVDATDFIVKPVQYAAFSMRMKRVLRAMQQRRGTSIAISTDGGSRIIPSNSVYYVEVINHQVIYHTDQGCFTVRGKLGDVEQQLPADAFFRCSISYLINLRYVTMMNSGSVIVAGDEIKVSRAKRKELAAALAVYMGKGG